MTTRQPRPGVATSVQQLLLHDDADFVRLAYLTLLGREPDDSGLDTYVAMLRSGVDRRDLIAVLAESVEGRQTAAALAGLPELVAAYRPQRSLGERLWRRLVPAGVRARSEAFEQDMRRAANRLAQIEAGLARQDQQLAALQQALARLNAPAAAAAAEGPARAGAAPLRQALPRQVPPAADDALRRLQRIQWLRSRTGR